MGPLEGEFPWSRTAAGKCGKNTIIYFGEHQPKHFRDGLPKEGRYEVDIIDTWNMTIETLEGTYEGQTTIELPGRPYIAMRVRAV